MPLQVATWNVFHGRAAAPVRRSLLDDYAAALAGAPWEVCGLQELPPWWALPLGEACGASVRVARTSLLRAALPAVQRRLAQDPERLGVRGAAVNALLVRPSAGTITAHRRAVLRRAPQRRTLQAVRLARPGGAVWVANVHTHNRPVDAATADLRRALAALRAWAGNEPVVVLGDLNVLPPVAREVSRRCGLQLLASDRVDHVLATPSSAAIVSDAQRPRTLDASVALSDHRLLTATLTLPDRPRRP